MSNDIAFAPVYSGLVSDYERGRYTGVLAESWTASSDFKQWDFRLRRGITFEDGREVGAGDILASWRRLAVQMRRRGSRGGFLEKLEGFERMGGDGSISGLSNGAGAIRLRFKVPFPNLLAALSETMNSVVAPECYHPKSGDWLCTRKAVSSGPYRLARWDENVLVLELRHDFPAEFRHPRALHTVAVGDRWSLDQVGLVFSASNRPPQDPDFVFHGGMEAGISFVACLSWAKPGSVCSARKTREEMRGALQRSLVRSGFAASRSFFPPAIPGIRDAELHLDAEAGSHRASGRTLLFDPMKGSGGYALAVNAAVAAAAQAVGARAVQHPLTVTEWNEELEPRLKDRRVDVAMVATEITPDQRDSSVRFMFRSKEGVRLPDPTGRIERELQREPLDFQRINDLLWDDAVVWPLEHFAWGTWARASFDLSKLNSALPNPRVQWIGVRG